MNHNLKPQLLYQDICNKYSQKKLLHCENMTFAKVPSFRKVIVVYVMEWYMTAHITHERYSGNVQSITPILDKDYPKKVCIKKSKRNIFYVHIKES